MTKEERELLIRTAKTVNYIHTILIRHLVVPFQLYGAEWEGKCNRLIEPITDDIERILRTLEQTPQSSEVPQ